jgi:parallel beta-helix repeat protein
MNITRLITFTAIATASISATSLSTASATGDGATVGCGSVVTTDVRLEADLIGCPEYGLVVGAPGITIDLGGHTISGAGIDIARAGVFNELFADVTVRNGEITGFGRGVHLYQASGNTLKRLDLYDNNEAISLDDSDRTTISRSVLHHNLTGLQALQSDRLTFAHTFVHDNRSTGATDKTSVGNLYKLNNFTANEFDGLSLEDSDDTTIDGNHFLFNGIDGLNATGGSDRMVLIGNTAIRNDGNGFVADGDQATLRRNLAIANNGIGILAFEGAVDGGRNRAVANRDGNCAVITCRP